MTQDLLKAVQARHYIFSTNNSYFQHPNDEAVARVVTAGGKPTLWFNYDTPKNRAWAEAALVQRYGHQVQLAQGSAGIRIELRGRR